MTPIDGIIVIAAGGHARVVIDALIASGVNVRGVIDPNIPVGRKILGVTVIGPDNFLDGLGIGKYLLANGLGANPNTERRTTLHCRFVSRGFRFARVIHPSAIISREVLLGEGCQVMAGAVLQCGTQMGCNAVVNTAASIDHDVVIGDNVFVASNATLCGNVFVGAGSFIGAGSTVLPGVRIGVGAVVGAGAVVCRDIPDGECHLGVPARMHRRL